MVQAQVKVATAPKAEVTIKKKRHFLRSLTWKNCQDKEWNLSQHVIQNFLS